MDNNAVKRFIAEELAAGVTLSEVQKLVNDRFGSELTFMDIRILASEIEGIDWGKDEEEAAPKAEAPAETPPAEEDTQANTPSGGTKIEINKIVRPGMALSGTVQFASGASADWFLDREGRLDFDNVQGQPTQEDLQQFMTELKKAVGGQ